MEGNKNRPPTSRLIVKNIPKHYKEERLRQTFSRFGTITDAKIIRKKSSVTSEDSSTNKKLRSRQFAYIGFKSEEEAKKTKEYFNGTYLDTSKIVVDYAYPQDSEFIPRSWSRYSKDSSAYLLQHKSQAEKINKKKNQAKEKSESKASLEEIERKKAKYKGFLEYIAKKKTPKQSWNDVFNNYISEDKEEEENEVEEIEEKKKPEAKEAVSDTKMGKIKASTVLRKTKAGMADVKTHIRFNDIEEQEHMTDAIKEVKQSVAGAENETEEAESKKPAEMEVDETRLYIMNLPFNITEDEVNAKFSLYGNIENVFIPKDYSTGAGKGYAYVAYSTAESAIDAFAHLDKTIFQGRKLHILPAQKKPVQASSGLVRAVVAADQEKQTEEAKAPENAEPYIEQKKRKEKSTYKAKKAEELKRNYDEETNWNYLFINPNTVASAMANKLQVSKGELLSKESNNAAVRLALSETHLIKETKDWLKANGVNVSVFDGNARKECKRSNRLILVKNISDKITEAELKELFERYGEVRRLLVGPNNTLAIVEYSNPLAASVAMKKNAYYSLHGLPLYLEYAPQGVIADTQQPKPEETKMPPEEPEDAIKYGRTIFVKNLNFDTTEAKLADTFESAKAGKIVSVRIVKNKANNKSMGYGFVEYATEEAALDAIKSLQNVIIDEHSLKLSISKKKLAEKQVKEMRAKLKRKVLAEVDNPEAEHKTGKLLVKNLAFEATKKDIRQLFGSFGQIKKLRIPKKFDGSHRGFCFVEFYTKEDAKGAFKALQSSHLYGRKLVIQWAKDEELSTKELQEKTEARFEAMTKENPKGITTHEKAELVVQGGKRKKFDEEQIRISYYLSMMNLLYAINKFANIIQGQIKQYYSNLNKWGQFQQNS
eukprot:TRINITY_DN105141_c1_g1_i1.p1 TRINITY_DN105141_c1_g1~~TRINITY_DN105141_c1_g1_i1.p1  ORF type:complete len:883 (-),score=168.68 TRINITY_DN105141_c1_g1_i1:5214-7862(-)